MNTNSVKPRASPGRRAPTPTTWRPASRPSSSRIAITTQYSQGSAGSGPLMVPSMRSGLEMYGPRSRSLVTNFADQWLYLRNLEAITPDARLFPDFDHNLRESLRTETSLLLTDVIQNDRNVLALLRTDRTWLDERLAAHYGIPHVHGSRFREVKLTPEMQRGGLLRQGSIQTVTSYATRTSPVIRGH